jgi:hypothetical protein
MPGLIKWLLLVLALGIGFVLGAHLASTRSMFIGLQDMTGLRPVSTVSLMSGELKYRVTTSNQSYTQSTLSTIETLIGWNQPLTNKSSKTPKDSLGQESSPAVEDPGNNDHKIDQSPLCADRGQGLVDVITYSQRHTPTLRPFASPLASGRGYVDGGTAQGKQGQQASFLRRSS